MTTRKVLMGCALIVLLALLVGLALTIADDGLSGKAVASVGLVLAALVFLYGASKITS